MNFVQKIQNMRPWARRTLFVSVSVILVALIVATFLPVLGIGVNGGQTKQPETPLDTSPLTNVSPFLFGANLILTNEQDPFLTSPDYQQVVQQLHLKTTRISIQANTPEAPLLKTARQLKTFGITPIFTLSGLAESGFLDRNKHLLDQIKQIFPQQQVFYEIGNEEDLQGMSPEKYTGLWNSIVPELRKNSTTAHFLGPVTYHFDATYLQTFLQTANPRPDEISWHAYSCVQNDTQDTCMAGIEKWKTQITTAKQLMAQTIGVELPIVISEWGYAPANNDQKTNVEADFLRQWTNQALHMLADQQVFAAAYQTLNGSTPLINQNQPTIQGTIFQNQYEAWVKDTSVTQVPTNTPTNTSTSTVTANTPTPTATNTPTTTPKVPVPAENSPEYGPFIYKWGTTSTPPVYAATLANQDGMQWQVSSQDIGDCQFSDQALKASTKILDRSVRCMAQQTNIRDFALEVDATITAGKDGDGSGIAFRYLGNRFLRFHIGSNGVYDLVDEKSEKKALLNGQLTSADYKMGLNQTNRITVIGKGEDIWFYINGKLFTHYAHKDTPNGGQLGLFAYGNVQKTTVLYRNIKIWNLSAQTL